MSGLHTYQDRRFELGDMIRTALHVARASGDEEAEKRARDLLARLAADRSWCRRKGCGGSSTRLSACV